MSYNITHLVKQGKCPNPSCDKDLMVRLIIETTPLSEPDEKGVLALHGQVIGAQQVPHDCVAKTLRERRSQ